MIQTTLEFQIWIAEVEKLCNISHYNIHELIWVFEQGYTPDEFYMLDYTCF